MRFQQTIGEWQNKTFPNIDTEGKIAKLIEEVGELRDAHDFGDHASLIEEAADCYIVLMGLAELEGFDLHRAALAKHVINSTREWDEDGRHRE